ncbi:MAG: D-alanine--D-alanine ligase [Planctomycetota bacterium]|jgi:D-alanine-D-alanine ligase|nr:D-alanine--D-alanine ligase [Planctomycetota bacterium]
MRIGFTYDLLDEHLAGGLTPEEAAEFDKPETMDAIEGALRDLGHDIDRIGGLDRLVKRLAGGASWDLVFNIAEGVRGAAREAQIPALLEAYGIPATFGDSLCLALCLHKGHAKRIVRDQGIPTPGFAVVAEPETEPAGLDLAFPLFVKPVAEGTGKGVSARGLVREPAELPGICRELISVHRQPVLVEEYLPGREFTVGVVGTGRKARVIGVMEVRLLPAAEPGAYTFGNKAQYLNRVDYRLAGDSEAREAGGIALAAYRLLGCRDGGRADLRSDGAGHPQFMEMNPLAGLHPEHSDLPILCRLAGIGFPRLIAEILASARERTREGE